MRVISRDLESFLPLPSLPSLHPSILIPPLNRCADFFAVLHPLSDGLQVSVRVVYHSQFLAIVFLLYSTISPEPLNLPRYQPNHLEQGLKAKLKQKEPRTVSIVMKYTGLEMVMREQSRKFTKYRVPVATP